MHFLQIPEPEAYHRCIPSFPGNHFFPFAIREPTRHCISSEVMLLMRMN
jgi:hypothetical protein